MIWSKKEVWAATSNNSEMNIFLSQSHQVMHGDKGLCKKKNRNYTEESGLVSFMRIKIIYNIMLINTTLEWKFEEVQMQNPNRHSKSYPTDQNHDVQGKCSLLSSSFFLSLIFCSFPLPYPPPFFSALTWVYLSSEAHVSKESGINIV